MPSSMNHSTLAARTLAAFAEEAAAIPVMTLRGGNAMDDGAPPPAFDAAADAITDAYLEAFFWGVSHLDTRSWKHYLPPLIEYALRNAHESSLVVEALLTSFRPPDRDPPRLAALSTGQQVLITELLDLLAFGEESAHQELACQALEEWWVPSAIYRP